jgi:hypothetical protein
VIANSKRGQVSRPRCVPLGQLSRLGHPVTLGHLRYVTRDMGQRYGVTCPSSLRGVMNWSGPGWPRRVPEEVDEQSNEWDDEDDNEPEQLADDSEIAAADDAYGDE